MSKTFSEEKGAGFKAAYAALNPAQKEAVDTIEGPVMVVAGPGTGKTQILTLRIANILLQTDTPPDGILALTFTESGAKAMRERLRQYVGAAAYQVPIFTFHGFSQLLIAQYPDAYERVIGGRPASDLEKISLIESIINDGEVKLLRPMGDPSYYVTHVLRIIGQLKQEYITPDGLVDIVNQQEQSLQEVEQYHTKGAHKGKVRGEYSKLEKSLAKNRELVYVYRRYEALLSEQRLYDFEDMIIETVRALETKEDMLRDLQERYLYILADEHQDVNGSQNKILELLASFHERPNIFAVGDEKQAIYRFQGASLENFLYFTEQFKDTKVISLTENYRSGQTILDAAHSLVAVDEGPLQALRIPLVAKAVPESKLVRRDFSHQAVEDEWVVQAVQEEISAGVSAREIAIIVRTNREVESFAALLRKAGVPVSASADGDVLRHPVTEAVRALMEAVIADKSETALFEVLHGAYWGISHDDLVRVMGARTYQRSLTSLLSDEATLQSLRVQNPDKLLRVHEVLTEARAREVHESPHRVLEYVLQASGFLDHLMIHDPLEGARVLRRLYDEIEEMVLRDGITSLRAVSDLFKARLAYGLPLNAPYISTSAESVQVMTAHKSKGLEFTTVFIPHLVDSVWSGVSKRSYFTIPLQQHAKSGEGESTEDERRLLYVAMTRPKQRLTVTTAGTNADGRELIPSRLLEAVDPSCVTSESTEKTEQAFDPISLLSKPTPALSIDASLLKLVLTERGFSATSLNNYLRSPWDYFYRNVLRIPETQPAHMQYGTAIHNTLEYMTHSHTTEGELPSLTLVKQKIERELQRLPLSVEEYTRLLEKGLEDLTRYREHLVGALPKRTLEEFSVRVMLQTGLPEVPEIPLTGKLDRIDLTEDGYALRVVDYKTGKPKSRNVIEGKTKDADGGYKRQLVFYALLMQLYDDERYQCREGVLSFVQADAKGVIKEEAFVVTDEEIAGLTAEIKEAVRAIVTGVFLEVPCEEKVSDYCRLVEKLRR
jgi:DNA helicase II / ATP-dependent DNA helicase PcrA